MASEIMRCIAYTTWSASVDLAKERGVFPCFEKEKYSQSEFVKQLPQEMQHDIQKFGVRHSHHNTIAPTGTISLLANNVSHGIEPIFSAVYQRNIRTTEGELQTFHVKDFGMHAWHKENLPPAWVDVQSLTPQDHLHMQAAVQPYIDNAISKTINVPADYPFAKLNDVYTEAYALGLKGCTIYRPNPVTGSVLSVPTADDVDHCSVC